MKAIVFILLFWGTLKAAEPSRLENARERYVREQQSVVLKYLDLLEKYRNESAQFKRFGEVEHYTNEIQKTKNELKLLQGQILGQPEKYVGKWKKLYGRLIEFKSDGTYLDLFDNTTGAYKIENGKIFLDGKHWFDWDGERIIGTHSGRRYFLQKVVDKGD